MREAGEAIWGYRSDVSLLLRNAKSLIRRYLFDCDGYQISNPPDGISEIDERLGALAAASQRRAVRMALHEDDNYSYSACSVDAFHYGNFTRFLNHRCDPNLTIAQAYAFVSF